jgi:hypothetical protein
MGTNPSNPSNATISLCEGNLQFFFEKIFDFEENAQKSLNELDSPVKPGNDDEWPFLTALSLGFATK